MYQNPTYARHALRLVGSLLLATSLLGAARASTASQRKTLVRVAPDYPAAAKPLRLSGVVRIEIRIAEDGSVKVLRVLGGHPLLADCASKAISRWRYEHGAAETREVQVTFAVPADSY